MEDKINSKINNSDKEKENNPQEEMYYIENGNFVFTEKFHLKRGYCCGSGCRHCPFND